MPEYDTYCYAFALQLHNIQNTKPKDDGDDDFRRLTYLFLAPVNILQPQQ